MTTTPSTDPVSAAPSRFAHDTAVRSTGDSRYVGEVTSGWAVMEGGAPNGGYLMAIAARAMGATIAADERGPNRVDPVSVTAHFLAPAVEGPVDIDVEVVRAGRRHATLHAAMRQDGRECVRLLGTFADLDATGSDDVRVDRQPPPYPPVAECLDFTAAAIAQAEDGGYPPPPILHRFDHRVPHELAGWAVGRPAGRGEMGGHVRWYDGAEMDPLGVLAVLDCYPPAVFNTGDGSLGWVPTIELTVQLRRRPSPGYLTARLLTQAITAGGYLEEDGEVWDAEGRLVALSRQLALAAR